MLLLAQLIIITTIVAPASAEDFTSYIVSTSSVASASSVATTSTDNQILARQAYIYGFPIVENYKIMYGYAIDSNGEQYKAPFNTLKNEAEVFTPSDTTVVTPNCDALTSFLWMDLRTEPLVLGVPEIEKSRYYSIQFIDLYTYNFDYIGSRTTGNGAGHYKIAGPNWKGKKPAGVDKVIHCETEFAYARYRTQLFNPDDQYTVKNIQKQYTVQTLSDFQGIPAPAAAPVIDFPPIDQAAATPLAFFKYLTFMLQFCPAVPSETNLMASFARIGILASNSFDVSKLSPEIQDALKSCMTDGQATIATIAPKANSADIFGTRAYLGSDYLKRAVAAKVNLYGNSKEEILSSLYLTDAKGNPLDTSQTKYIITADQLPPVNAFWSLTMYDRKSQALVQNPINRYLINSFIVENFKRTEDDSLTLYIQHESPGEDKASNWLPAPDGEFYMVMRMYWPKPETVDSTWKAALVWPEGAKQQDTVSIPEGVGTAQEVKSVVIADDPKPEMERPSIWGEPTAVKIGIYIVDVDSINSADQSFTASVFYQAQWKNPFLQHKGPGPIHRGVTEVWNTRLTIIGQQNIWRSFPESVEIQPNGEVTYRQKIWGHFSQPLDLHEFPQDKQVLTIHIVAAGLMEEDVKMIPLLRDGRELSGLAGKFSVPDFKVLSWKAGAQPYIAHKDGPGIAGFQMQISVERSPVYYVMKVIIPLCMIVIMSWLPRWINAKQIGTNIGISTTAFLTLVAYLFAITVLLPKVSYVTRLDRFIFLATLMVFTGLIHTVIDTILLNSKKEALINWGNHLAWFVYPITLVLVLYISFIL